MPLVPLLVVYEYFCRAVYNDIVVICKNHGEFLAKIKNFRKMYLYGCEKPDVIRKN